LAYASISAALFERERRRLKAIETGVDPSSITGQKIDLSLFETQLSVLANMGHNWLLAGVEGRRWGTSHASIVPYQAFLSKDGHVFIAAGNDIQFRRLCQVLGWDRRDPELASKFLTNSQRVANREELNRRLNQALSVKTTAEWLDALERAEIPSGPINSISQAFRHPQVAAREMIQRIDHPTVGPIDLIGHPAKFSQTPPSIEKPPPLLGEHTRSVLMSLLRYPVEKIDDLHNRGVIQIR